MAIHKYLLRPHLKSLIKFSLVMEKRLAVPIEELTVHSTIRRLTT